MASDLLAFVVPTLSPAAIMADLSQAARSSLRPLAGKPASAVAAFLYMLALAAAGLWAARAALLHPSAAASSAEWELVCMGEEIVGRKCVLALGGRVHEGLYLFSAGGQVQGVLAIGQVAVGLIAIGWVALGGLLALVRDAVTLLCTPRYFFNDHVPTTYKLKPQGVTALSPLVVLGLMAFGGIAPQCVVGATVVKSLESNGVLNFAFMELPGLQGAGGRGGQKKKAKESPRPGDNDDEDADGGSEEDESENGRRLRRRPQASSEDWPYESSRGRYAQGA